jgi:WNK lysine deficient protein kinase
MTTITNITGGNLIGDENSSGTSRGGNEAIVEIRDQYIRFGEVIRRSFNSLLTSYKAFDTTNGVEIAWHKISFEEMKEHEKTKFIHFIHNLNEIAQREYFVDNLSYWFSDSTQTIDTSSIPGLLSNAEIDDKHHRSKPSTIYFNIITSNLETIREFIGKVKTLRWKIVKKWCRQILQALECLNNHSPPIIFNYLSCAHIFIDGGLGTIALGDVWLSFQSSSLNQNIYQAEDYQVSNLLLFIIS